MQTSLLQAADQCAAVQAEHDDGSDTGDVDAHEVRKRLQIMSGLRSISIRIRLAFLTPDRWYMFSGSSNFSVDLLLCSGSWASWNSLPAVQLCCGTGSLVKWEEDR